MSELTERVAIVRQRIKKAAREAGRDADDILLLAVTKAQSITRIKELSLIHI